MGGFPHKAKDQEIYYWMILKGGWSMGGWTLFAMRKLLTKIGLSPYRKLKTRELYLKMNNI